MKILIIILLLTIYILCLFYYYVKLTKFEKEEYSNKNNWNDIISDCYYINLDRSKDRRIYMENTIKNIDIPCTRLPAKEGKDYIKKYKKINITSGALGCKLSHLEILKNIKNDGRWTVIFEDDVLFDETKPVKKEIVNFLSNIPKSAELVLFGTSPICLWFNFITFGFEYHAKNIWKTKRNLTCCHAYAINYNGAQKWIPQIEKFLYEKPFDMHSKNIDIIYFCNTAKTKKDFLRILSFLDVSYIKQNKDKFGYFDSLVTDLSFFS